MNTCAFVGCYEVEQCPLVGGCVMQRFPAPAPRVSDIKDGARALAGIKPARTNRDPALIKRRRKALTP